MKALALKFQQQKNPLKVLHEFFWSIDPRLTIATLLFSYLVLGFTVLGFNRTPMQAAVTTASACLLEIIFSKIFRGRIQFPLSAMITSFSLSILLNYSHNYYVLLIPVFFAIGTKYIFTFNDRHLYNPAQVAVTFSLLFASDLITSAPAYQWTGITNMGIFIAGLGTFLLVPQVKRFPLVLSFLFFFTLQILFRAWLMKHHLPFITLFFGTITSPAFFLFTFFMITDPQTSPKETKSQIIVGFLLAFFDLLFHLKQSYHTFFFAGFTVQSGRLLFLHAKAISSAKDPIEYFKQRFIQGGYWMRPLILGLIAIISLLAYHAAIKPELKQVMIDFTFEEVSKEKSGVDSSYGGVLNRTDERVQHIAKWLLSVGDSVAVGDFDADGLVDLFFTNVLKRDQDRNALFRNLGEMRFERVQLPMIADKTANVEKYGLPSNAMFVDVDNDHDLDLFITYAFGSPILLQNQLKQTGRAEFLDVTREKGLNIYTNSISANFLDINRDGRLDLIIGNVWPKYLPDYPKEKPQKLNLFKLPGAEYEGDIRMFNFMHESWHMADNGGVNDLFLQDESGRFIQQDSAKWGMPEHFWTLALGTADLNQDGYTDLYVANDFGPDQLYYNIEGKRFEKIEGKIFGSIGKDTYKGMNASIADIDGNGWQDVYISNVHHQLQAEGSLLWMFAQGKEDGRPDIRDEATTRNALNENRFGWGAAVVDFNNDGRPDIAQANGMVDDSIDRQYDKCPDFWYVNEKIARSAPEVHKYIHNWGDIRGHCIYGEEQNRLYLNNGNPVNTFIDVADAIGMKEKNNSRGMSATDLDNDGNLDLIVTHQFKAATIYHNRPFDLTAKNWLGISLHSDDVNCSSQGVGSTVTINYIDKQGSKKMQVREVQVVNGFSAQNDMRLHFGLGDYNGPLEVNVNWCQKKITRHTLNANQYQNIAKSKEIL